MNTDKIRAELAGLDKHLHEVMQCLEESTEAPKSEHVDGEPCLLKVTDNARTKAEGYRFEYKEKGEAINGTDWYAELGEITFAYCVDVLNVWILRAIKIPDPVVVDMTQEEIDKARALYPEVPPSEKEWKAKREGRPKCQSFGRKFCDANRDCKITKGYCPGATMANAFDYPAFLRAYNAMRAMVFSLRAKRDGSGPVTWDAGDWAFDTHYGPVYLVREIDTGYYDGIRLEDKRHYSCAIASLRPLTDADWTVDVKGTQYRAYNTEHEAIIITTSDGVKLQSTEEPWIKLVRQFCDDNHIPIMPYSLSNGEFKNPE